MKTTLARRFGECAGVVFTVHPHGILNTDLPQQACGFVQHFGFGVDTKVVLPCQSKSNPVVASADWRYPAERNYHAGCVNNLLVRAVFCITGCQFALCLVLMLRLLCRQSAGC